MQDPRQLREEKNELIYGPGLQALFVSEFKPKLDELKKTLLTNRDLNEGDRRGFITARQIIIEGFSNIFEKRNEHLPIWLEKEVN